MNYRLRFFFWLLAVIGLIIVVILLLMPNSKNNIAGTTFINYASSNTATATLIIDASEQANSTHQAVKIAVSKNEVVYQQLATYNYNVINTKIYKNNYNSFYVFLRALYFAGYLNGNQNPIDGNSYGVCPLGDRYTFNFTKNHQTLIHYWATSCGNKTYRGNVNLTLNLFEGQVPNFQTLTENINF